MENEEMNPGQAKLSTTVIEPDAYGGHAPNVQTAIQRFNLKRSSTRNESKVDFSHDRIQRSLHDCKVNNNLTKLQNLMRSSSGTLFKRKCNALHGRRSWGGLGGCSPPSFCQIFAKSPFFASNFSISMPTAPSRSSQPPHFQIHSAVYALITILETLLVPADYKMRIDGLCVKGEKVKGFMDFQDGLNIFIDVTELNTLDVRKDDLRARFRDAILDKIMGCIVFYLNI